MGNRREWKHGVDEQLSRLRAHLLGEDIPLDSFAPTELDDAARLSWLADWLAFNLACECTWADKGEALRAKCWLYAALKFLSENCPDSDFTFTGLKKLLDMGETMRLILFEDAEPREVYSAICSDSVPPEPLAIIERVYAELVPENIYLERKHRFEELKKYIPQK